MAHCEEIDKWPDTDKQQRKNNYQGHIFLSYFIKIYKTIILPVVLYGCETWPLTLREEFRLRLFENRILRRIFGPKRDANREWRRLHNELHNLYRSPNIVMVIKSRRLRWAGHVSSGRR